MIFSIHFARRRRDDVETDFFAVLNGKINNPSMRGEIIHVADVKTLVPLARAKNSSHAPPVGPADENQMATLSSFKLLAAFNH